MLLRPSDLCFRISPSTVKNDAHEPREPKYFMGFPWLKGQSRQIIHHMATSSDERHTHASSLREPRLRTVHALYMCICDGKNSVFPPSALFLTSTFFMEV